jgi:ribosome recycling factor
MPEQVLREMREHMEQSIEVLKSNLTKVQTGRAQPAMVEDVVVDYYGTHTPLRQLATIAAPDANLLVVQPYDKSQMEAFEKAILGADLGLNPANDGKVIRIKIPKLSEERRQELTKLIKGKGEEAKVALRNIRRDANEKLDRMKSDGDISEDDHHRYRGKTDDAVHEFSEKAEELIDQKSQQLQTI